MLRREKLDHLMTTQMIEEKRRGEKHREKILGGLTEWLNVGRVTDTLKAMRDRDTYMWKIKLSALNSRAPD